MAARFASLGVTGLIACSLTWPTQAQELSERVERARTACAAQIESAFDALHAVCTAAVVIDLAATPDSPSCGLARSVIVEYVTACMEHASALLQEGEPLELPPFPDLGPGVIAAEGEIGRQPAPQWWPWPFVLDIAQLPVVAAEMKHETLRGSVQGTMIGTPTRTEPDGATAPADGAVGDAAQPGGGEQVGTSAGPQPDVEVGPPGRPISGEAAPRSETDDDAD